MAFNLLWIVIPLVFLIPVLPLYLLVHLLGGQASLLRVIGVKIGGLILSGVLSIFLGGIAGLAVFVLMLFVYMFVFELSFVRALGAWILDGILMAILLLVALFLLGMQLSASGVLPK